MVLLAGTSALMADLWVYCPLIPLEPLTLTGIFLCCKHTGLGKQVYVYRRRETASRQARVGCAARLRNILMAQELCCHASDDRVVAFCR